MKVGSLVELVNDNWREPIYSEALRMGFIFPVKKVIYTVRGIEESNGKLCIFLEEIVNKKYWFGESYEEPSFPMIQFREVLPADAVDISELLEEPILMAA